MRLKISELLVNAQLETLPGAPEACPDGLREAVERKIKEENMHKSRPRRGLKTLLIAAAVAVILSAAALAVGFGLRDAAQGQAFWPSAGETAEVMAACPAGSAEAAALAEWEAYLAENDMSAAYESYEEFESARDALPSGAWKMGALTEEGVERLSEICKAHGLAAPQSAEALVDRAAFGLEGRLPAHDGRAAKAGGTLYDTGSFVYNDALTLEDGGYANYHVYFTAKGAMPVRAGFFANLEEMEQWTLESDGGAGLLLGMGGDYSVVFAESEDGWLLVHLRAGAEAASGENGGAALSRAGLERFALGLFPAG